jgi:hypothetical protein
VNTEGFDIARQEHEEEEKPTVKITAINCGMGFQFIVSDVGSIWGTSFAFYGTQGLKTLTINQDSVRIATFDNVDLVDKIKM